MCSDNEVPASVALGIVRTKVPVLSDGTSPASRTVSLTGGCRLALVYTTEESQVGMFAGWYLAATCWAAKAKC